MIVETYLFYAILFHDIHRVLDECASYTDAKQGEKERNRVSYLRCSSEESKVVGYGNAPMPRLRQFLFTLSIAIYPLFARSLCILCLHTMTPIGSEFDGSAGYAYVID